MRITSIISLILCLAALSGCRSGLYGKRVSEMECPTDIRQTHCWCFGEDAIFHDPCGPTHAFYGHRPTCWREWPTSGGVWRDVYCVSAVQTTTSDTELPYLPSQEELTPPVDPESEDSLQEIQPEPPQDRGPMMLPTGEDAGEELMEMELQPLPEHAGASATGWHLDPVYQGIEVATWGANEESSDLRSNAVQLAK